ncbi:MAG: 4-hydroxy-3-methylbut-2-en-1-yl diphosphate synthase [Bacteroidia bacterium]|nr:MAG: 4-hydroxy-3-methylbut-2-en-1-yl diphosphate synthase [Bacteroidia bacterium]
MQAIFSYKKRKTNEIKIGELSMGGTRPVRIQSMTNTDTNNVEATIAQIISIYKAGADLVRITVPSMQSVKNAAIIQKELKKKGYAIPLIADVHFSPKVALACAKIFDKVRINPGNYVDKKEFKHIVYTEKSYQEAVRSIRTQFVPLLEVCKAHKTAIRIGTNHGSLSDRILSRYGDTPEGMVESTMEFLRICKQENFSKIIISMKASNPKVMIDATRLLVKKMEEEDMHYGIHLGVTEAGNEEDGRIKSAIGIGSLLADGIGDTIRVSLTEPPENEIPVAKELCNLFASNHGQSSPAAFLSPFENSSVFLSRKDPRTTFSCGIIGAGQPAVVVSDTVTERKKTKENNKPATADFTFTEKKTEQDSSNFDPAICLLQPLKNNKHSVNPEKKDLYRFKEILIHDIITQPEIDTWKNFKGIFVLNLSGSPAPIHQGRYFFALLDKYSLKNPVILKMQPADTSWQTKLKVSAELGSLLTDGLGDGIWLQCKQAETQELNNLSFSILQACRLRITKPDYISCPSCGRTLFNLEEVTAEIKARTAHLKGVKIGIMGCIVNGPGEMADADFGYVGSSPGKITLYRKQEPVKRNIPEENAVEELLRLIEAEYKEIPDPGI